MYSRDNPKRISRASLEHIRDQLTRPLQTTPPTIGTYPHELDVELYRLFWSNPVTKAEASAVTLGGLQVRQARQVWVYEIDGFEDTYIDDKGVQRTVWVPDRIVREIPHYASNTEDALGLKDDLLHYEFRLVIEEIEKGQPLALWNAKILDPSNKVVGEGETFDIGGSIVLAVVSCLLSDPAASWWVVLADAP